MCHDCCSIILVKLWQEYVKLLQLFFIVVGCFPIVPGKGIYQTMLYLISHDQDLFLDSLFQTVGTALALATCNFNCFNFL